MTLIPKPKLHYAGGFNIVGGHPTLFPFMKRGKASYVRAHVKQRITQLVQAGDQETILMLSEFEAEILTYSRYEYSQWTSLKPLEKQQALTTWIIAQGKRKRQFKYSHVDILAAGVAGLLYNSLRPEGQLKTPYARAVDCARAVFYLFRPERRTYEHDNGHGLVTRRSVWINKKVQLRSRFAAQRIEKTTLRYAGQFMERYAAEILLSVSARS